MCNLWCFVKYKNALIDQYNFFLKKHPFSRSNGYVFQHRIVLEEWLKENQPDHPTLIEIDGVKYLAAVLFIRNYSLSAEK